MNVWMFFLQIVQLAPLNRITVNGIFWLIEYNLQVQNHLYICTVVNELLKGIPLQGIFWIYRNKNFTSLIFKEYINHTAYKNSTVNVGLSKSVIATLQQKINNIAHYFLKFPF